MLFATDEPRAKELVTAASKAHPPVETQRTEIRHSAFSRATVDPVLQRIGNAAQAGSLPFPVHTAALLPDASGITATTTKEGATSPALREAVAELAGTVPEWYGKSGPVHHLDATAQMVPPP
ncbi:hypothetical protein ACIRS1_35635 [Kitasatospora sp. NPDC101176]|uniref:hypothetical protein n=1 Tax=Kitasatospora sp. NPDC101176 TaxID=3364099 RepID=UPI0038096F8B